MNCLLGNYLEETNGVPVEKYWQKCDKNCRKRGMMKYKKREAPFYQRERSRYNRQPKNRYACENVLWQQEKRENT